MVTPKHLAQCMAQGKYSIIHFLSFSFIEVYGLSSSGKKMKNYKQDDAYVRMEVRNNRDDTINCSTSYFQR